MRWPVFILMLFIALAVQMFLSLLPSVGPWRPDVLLILFLYVSLWAPGGVTLFAALVAGTFQDIASGTFGPFAFGYALVGFMMLRLRLAVYKEHPASHIVIAIASSALLVFWLTIGLRVIRWLVRLILWSNDPAPLNALVLPQWPSWIATILLAPLFIRMLSRMKKSFGFKSSEL
ncbi:MAG TPA: rod shape-determining protein MreD [Tepidisphaeraceae bacterium]|nr:rod shape-determining protein MreD [Tepidisphaeraceae bacterium]